eukprot:13127653-Ditylum_brightwellii.AAC.1
MANMANMEGAVDIAKDEDYVAQQLWPTVLKAIQFSNGLMNELFSTLVVSVEDQSPFHCDFTSLEDLRDEFISYCPHTFSYDNQSGGGDDVDSSDEPSDDDTGSSSEQLTDKSMLEHIKNFTSLLVSNDDDDDNDSIGVDISDEEGNAKPSEPSIT